MNLMVQNYLWRTIWTIIQEKKLYKRERRKEWFIVTFCPLNKKNIQDMYNFVWNSFTELATYIMIFANHSNHFHLKYMKMVKIEVVIKFIHLRIRIERKSNILRIYHSTISGYSPRSKYVNWRLTETIFTMLI